VFLVPEDDGARWTAPGGAALADIAAFTPFALRPLRPGAPRRTYGTLLAALALFPGE